MTQNSESCKISLALSLFVTLKDILFLQDNASVHKAYRVMAWFERNDVGLEEHPPYCTDLILLSMHGLTFKSDYTNSRQALEIPQVEKKLFRGDLHKYCLWFVRQFLRSFLKYCGNQCLIE